MADEAPELPPPEALPEPSLSPLHGYTLLRVNGKWGWCRMNESMSLRGRMPFDTLQEVCDQIVADEKAYYGD